MRKTKGKTLTLTERAVVARINRRLRHQRQMLRRSRTKSSEVEVGKYWVLDLETSSIVRHHVDLRPLAHELGCLHPWEKAAA